MNALIQRLEIIALIAEGGQGRLFLGKPASISKRERLVVIKAFAKDHDFERESKILGSLSNRLIIRLYGTAICWQFSALISEFIGGTNLAILLHKLLESCKNLSYAGIIYLAQELLDALAYLDSQGVVHGDLAAENILISSEAALKLCDFGASVFCCDELPHRPFGRKELLAPELLQGHRPSRWSDLFALGAVLFELVTKEHYSLSSSEPCRMKLKVCLSAYPPALFYIISSCLSISPWQRPSCAALIRSRLPVMTEREIWKAKQELKLLIPKANFDQGPYSQTFVDFVPTAYF